MRPPAIIALALLAAACGSSPGGSHTTAGQPRDFAALAFKYAACMRDHGVSDFPDPDVTTTPDGGGSIRQAMPPSAANSPAFKSAQKACRSIIGPIGSGGGRPGREQPDKRTLLAFARCLRGRGVSDFPDPNGQGQLTLQMIRSAGVDLQAPSFLTAAKACVGVTHGAINLGQVEQAIHGPH